MKIKKIFFLSLIFGFKIFCPVNVQAAFQNRSSIALSKLFIELKATLLLEKKLQCEDFQNLRNNLDNYLEKVSYSIKSLDQGLSLIERIDSFIRNQVSAQSLFEIRRYSEDFNSISQEQLQTPHQIRDLEKICSKFQKKLAESILRSKVTEDLWELLEIIKTTVCSLCYRDINVGEHIIDYVWYRPKEFFRDNPEITLCFGACVCAYALYKGYCWWNTSQAGSVRARGQIILEPIVNQAGLETSSTSTPPNTTNPPTDILPDQETSVVISNNSENQNQIIHIQQLGSMQQGQAECGYFALANCILAQADSSGQALRNVAVQPQDLRELVNIWQNTINLHRNGQAYGNGELNREEIEVLMHRDQIQQAREPLARLGVNVDGLQFNPETNHLAHICILDRQDIENGVFSFLDDDMSQMHRFRQAQCQQVNVIANTPGHWVSVIAQRNNQGPYITFIDSANHAYNYNRYRNLIPQVIRLLFTQEPLLSEGMRRADNDIQMAYEHFLEGRMHAAFQELNNAQINAQPYLNNPNFREIRLRLEHAGQVIGAGRL